ncbi:hypothetical protein OWV82_006836 [Melia azedarach]|uniref:Uncharacterized protein n=1 Tax=Melia azedarach TaxID=155640 RepID=A0ACC1YJ53_MELAZ|nr:hypothetical protein OWV82_006836 [Melia azedarach]
MAKHHPDLTYVWEAARYRHWKTLIEFGMGIDVLSGEEYVRAPLFEFAMIATMDLFRADVLSTEEWGSLMPTTAKSVRSKRMTGMAVPKLLIWEVPTLTRNIIK